MKRYFMATMLLASATFAFAQNNDDWQIGGGRDDAPATQYQQSQQYEYDAPMQAREMNLFNGGYQESPVSFFFGYQNKVWETQYDDGPVKENFFGEPGKRLHGFSFGFMYQPCFKWGLGLRTGIACEIYISNSSYVKEKQFDDFTEVDLNFPLHATYRIPLSHKVSIAPFAGVGFNIALHGQYTEHNRYYDIIDGCWYDDPYHETQQYGHNQWPKRTNISAEFGFTTRIYDVNLSFTYSRGLTNHYVNNGYKSRQDKLNFTIGYLLPFE